MAGATAVGSVIGIPAAGAAFAAARSEVGLVPFAEEPATPNDQFFGEQWALPLIGAPQAWSRATGQGVTIAVVDTGVDLSHEDLAAHLVPGYNVLRPGAPPQDDNGHGTELAGIAAAVTNNGTGIAGVAPRASIMPIKVLDSTGEGDVTAVDQGIEWATAHGAQVINLSLGNLDPGEVAPQLGTAIDDAWNHGVICVVAAGNAPNSASGFTDQPAVVVGALGRNNTPVAYSSAIGNDAWGISAPGGQDDGRATDDILSTAWSPGHRNGYAFEAGTSMATAFVSGALADLLSMGLSPAQAVHQMLATAVTMGNPTRFGAGALDLAQAVGSVQTAASAGPVKPIGPGGSTPSAAVTPPTTAAIPPTTGVAPNGTTTPPIMLRPSAVRTIVGPRSTTAPWALFGPGGPEPYWPAALAGGLLVAVGIATGFRIRRVVADPDPPEGA